MLPPDRANTSYRLVLTVGLTLAANELLGIDPLLKWITAGAVAFMSIAMVGLAIGLGARYPRFGADNPSQVAGSYGGVMFMVLAVLYILVMIALLGWGSSVYLLHQAQGMPLPPGRAWQIAACFASAAAISLGTWWMGMRTGIRALETMKE